MSTTITGVVTNGVVVPNGPLPEGTRVEIHLQPARPAVATGGAARLTAGELRRMPRAQRQAVLAAAAELAEQDYRDDKDLTGFDAFSEEERDNDESDSHEGRGADYHLPLETSCRGPSKTRIQRSRQFLPLKA